jgi:hypothetical protein
LVAVEPVVIVGVHSTGIMVVVALVDLLAQQVFFYLLQQ